MTPRIRAWFRRGSVLIWLSGAALALSVLMIGSLVGLLITKGTGVFWPSPLVQVQSPDGPVLGEITAFEAGHGEEPAKIQFRVGNRDLYGQDFRWYQVATLHDRTTPPEALLVERLEYGPFLGKLVDIHRGDALIASGPEALLHAKALLPEVTALRHATERMEKRGLGALNQKLEALRLAKGTDPHAQAKEQALLQQYQALEQRIEHLRSQSREVTLGLQSVDGQSVRMPLSQVVRLVAPNTMGWGGKLKLYASRLMEFLLDDPRESNTEGGIFPAIFGTVMMVMIMSVMVVPLGVLAALFLREYAKQGLLVRLVRIAVNNLAGVPSIVFGLFGLGFFIYGLGSGLDALFFKDKLPAPTFGTGGILWASLTLALLTVPVVIVATEEALASVPRSQREASLALGATKWQTMWKVVIPGATPGILTGLILAMARGAGEVAPLMLTGAVKLAPAMPLDGTFPFLHLDRKFMHLGFHIYDVGFQSPNSEAAKPMVFMTALLLLLVVLVLNLAALRLRQKLRARVGSSAF